MLCSITDYNVKCAIFDIDGVLTDGKIYVNHLGDELKNYKLTEIDALNDIHGMKILIVAVTGEDTPIVEVFKRRVDWDFFISGCKNKLEAVKQIQNQFFLSREELCYIGDGKYDIPAIKYAGLGVCPSNGIQEAKEAADIVLNGAGGESCIYELYTLLSKMKKARK